MPNKNSSVFISLVTYKTKIDDIKRLLSMKYNESFCIQIFDNSADDKLWIFCKQNNLPYIRSINNIGFGAGHNKNIEIFKKNNNNFDFVLILNPDIEITKDKILSLVKSYKSSADVGLLSPLLLNSDSSAQRQYQKIKPLHLFVFHHFLKKNKFLLGAKYKELYDVELLHGPCLLIRSYLFDLIGGFDQRYFLYFEDLDLSMQIRHLNKRVVIDSNISVIHRLQRESSSNFKLFLIHLSSLFKFYLKNKNFYKENYLQTK